MVVEEWLNLLPPEAGRLGLMIALGASIVGAAIWLIGARYSRPLITLLTVLIGAVVGMQMPRWFGWQVSGAGTAVAATLVFGITGYALHGMWVGIGLGTVLASWATLACWILFRNGAVWNWPAVEPGTSYESYLVLIWQSLPPDMARILPYAAATAVITGLAAAILWPKASLILGWSLAGTTLLASMGIAAIDYGRPQLLTRIPAPNWAQAALFAGIAGIGVIIQYKLAPKPAGTTDKPAGRKKSSSKAQ